MKYDKPNREDIHIWHLLNTLKQDSKCIDKQVACVIVDRITGDIFSTGVNKIIDCDKNCDDKEHRVCNTVHAEVMAIRHLGHIPKEDLIAYVNLFPCIPCQSRLAAYVSEIRAFGFVHKEPVFDNIIVLPDLSADLIEHDGKDKQLSVIQGELAELITCISDYFYRPDKLVPLEEILDEVVDVELMMENLKRIIWAGDKESYNVLRALRSEKLVNLRDKIL